VTLPAQPPPRSATRPLRERCRPDLRKPPFLESTS
jgi:hypothetical protein